MTKRVIFSLWSGPLPAVSELHFRSTLHHMGDAQYHLFLDSTPGFEGVMTESLRWLEDHPKVTITSINVSDYLLASGVDLRNPLEKVLPANTLRRWLRRWFTVRIGMQRLVMGAGPTRKNFEPRLPRGVFQSAEFGLTAGHGYRWWPLAKDLTYRADVFRIVAPGMFPDADVLWLDLDVAVTQDLGWLTQSDPFIYRWGELPFGNNAIMYYPASRPDARAGLVALMMSEGTARPWSLLTDKNCEKVGFSILPVDEFDPSFTEDSGVFADFDSFFVDSDRSAELARTFTTRFKMVHWHNNWKTVPSAHSPYSHLLSEVTVEVKRPKPSQTHKKVKK